MYNHTLTYRIDSSDRFIASVPNLRVDVLEKALNIERRRYREKQDLYVVAGQIYSLDLHPVDSWTLFRWMQEHNVPSRYLIRRESKFYKKIEDEGLTKDIVALDTDCLHDELLDQTDILVRAKAFFVEWRTDSVADIWLQHLYGCRYVFIDHGIVGTWYTNVLSDVFENEYNDLNVSSERELALVGTSEKIVQKCVVSGLPRFDLLKNMASTDKNSEKVVFVMFTWRSSLNNGQVPLEKTDYYKGIQALLSSELLGELDQQGVRVVFSPHHVIAHVLKNQRFKNAELTSSQEENAYWVRHSNMLITDFSSISFDFLFQEKPVVYWIPDKEDKLLNEQDKAKIASALQLRKNFFNTVDELEDVLKLLRHYVNNNFTLEENHRRIAFEWFSYRDNFSCRLFEKINERIEKEPINLSYKSTDSEMNTPKVSVIIPAYNAEKYLSTCLESFIVQDYDNFEVIVVDDGSNDYTRQICDSYVFKDMRIRVVHQENAGVSVARNKGIELAQGEYVTFVDADDWVEPNYLSTIVNTHPECDLLFFGNIHHHKDGTMHSYSPGERYAVEQIEREEVLLKMIQNDCWYEFFGYTWNKRFKTDIIKSNNIRFIPKLALREDEVFTDQYARHISSLACTSHCIYNYRFSYGGLTYRFHPGSEVLLLGQQLAKATDGIQHKRLYALKKTKVFHYMFTATLNLHTKEALEVFDMLYPMYCEYRDILTNDDNPFIDKRIRKRYKRIFAHQQWFSKLYFLVKRNSMKKRYNAV